MEEAIETVDHKIMNTDNPTDDAVIDDAPIQDPTDGRPEEIDDLIDDSLSDQDIENFAADINPPDFGGPSGSPGSGPGGLHDALHAPFPPPPKIAAAPARRMVRDPLAPGAGVASGLGYYLDIDPVLVRLAFVVGTFFTGPIAVLAYIAAWIIMPKANIWPPPGPRNTRNSQVAPRTLGLIIAGVGAAMILGFNLDGFGRIFGPLIMVGLGIWLLRQTPQKDTDEDLGTGGQSSGRYSAAGQPVYAAGTTPHRQVFDAFGNPVEVVPMKLRRSTSARLFRGALGLGALLGIVALVGGAVAVIEAETTTITINDGEIEASVGDSIGGASSDAQPPVSDGLSFGEASVTPALPADLGEKYSQTAGSFTLDLSNLNDAMFTETQKVDVENKFGELEVIIPEGLSVSIDAETDFGEIELFGDDEDGRDVEMSYSDDNPSIEIELDVKAGEIKVERP